MRHSLSKLFLVSLVLLAVACLPMAYAQPSGGGIGSFNELDVFESEFIYGFRRHFYGGTGTADRLNFTGASGFLKDWQVNGSSVFILDSTGAINHLGPLTTFMLGLKDTDRSHALVHKWNEDDSADRVLNWFVTSSNRSITLEGDTVLDQDLSVDSTPTFGDITTAGADPTHFFDTANPGDADFWTGVQEDTDGTTAGDTFQMGVGGTKGSNGKWSMDSDGDMGFGVLAIEATSQYQFLLDAIKNILIDGSTNPRNMTLGVLRILHTPAIPDTRAIHLLVDANSQGDTNGLFIAMSATGIEAGEDIMGLEVSLDSADSTGGAMEGLRVSNGGSGAAVAHGLHADPGVAPIHHEAGNDAPVEQGWTENGGFADTTVAFNTAGTDVTMFSSNGDKIYIGDDADFNAIRVNLLTVASGAGVRPKFEYSIAGPAWTQFTPTTDATNGFRISSTIVWDETAFSSWAAVNVSGATKKYIRITREQGGLGTPPVEETIQKIVSVEFEWDKDGDVTANSFTGGNVTSGVDPGHTHTAAGGADPQPVYPTDFTVKGDGSDNDINSIDDVDTTNRHAMVKLTGNVDTQDTDLYAYPLLAQALSAQDITISVNVSDKDNCTVNMLVTDADGNDDATGTVDITPVANDTWEDRTYTLTSAYAEDEKIRIKISIVSLDTGDIVRVGICTIPFN